MKRSKAILIQNEERNSNYNEKNKTKKQTDRQKKHQRAMSECRLLNGELGQGCNFRMASKVRSLGCLNTNKQYLSK